MRVLNLYAGLGGNRKFWPNEVEVTAVEIDANIAAEYKKNFPNDQVLVEDAHQYLLNHFDEFDFIWSSPPCPTHSTLRHAVVLHGDLKPMFPSMILYEEVIFLQSYSKCPFVVENVVSYYDPLIKPQERDRHYFWSNFYIPLYKRVCSETIREIEHSSIVFGFDVRESAIDDKRKALRNCVDPDLGFHVFISAFKVKQEVLIKGGGA